MEKRNDLKDRSFPQGKETDVQMFLITFIIVLGFTTVAMTAQVLLSQMKRFFIHKSQI